MKHFQMKYTLFCGEPRNILAGGTGGGFKKDCLLHPASCFIGSAFDGIERAASRYRTSIFKLHDEHSLLFGKQIFFEKDRQKTEKDHCHHGESIQPTSRLKSSNCHPTQRTRPVIQLPGLGVCTLHALLLAECLLCPQPR